MKRARHCSDVLNATLLYICLEVHMSPLLVAHSLHDVKGVELGQIHLRTAKTCRMWAG